MQDLDQELRDILLLLARDAISAALRGAHPPTAAMKNHPRLQERRAAFVTLTVQEQLRGCIGTLEANEGLGAVVSDCAVGAALRDPRFPAVTVHELEAIRISISVLAEPTPLRVSGREDLLARLRPGSDGLLVEAGRCRATFLPQVWEQLPDPDTFVNQLLRKAGLSADAWPADIRFQRYSSVSFSESHPRSPGL